MESASCSTALTTASCVRACMCWSMPRDRVATSGSSRLGTAPALLKSLCSTHRVCWHEHYGIAHMCCQSNMCGCLLGL
jgi:hypothetical protein